MSQGSLNPKIRFLGQKVWPVARSQTHRRTDTQSDYWGHRFRVSGFFPSIYHQGSAQYVSMKNVPLIGQWHIVLNVLDSCSIWFRKYILPLTPLEICLYQPPTQQLVLQVLPLCQQDDETLLLCAQKTHSPALICDFHTP